jgi:hypothetical protein
MAPDADAVGETIYLANYKPFEFTISEARARDCFAICTRFAAHAPTPAHARTQVNLSFDLRADGATVRAVIAAAASGDAAPLRLHGSPEVSLLSITLDGAPLAEGVGYTRTPDGGLVVEQAALPAAGTKFVLSTEVALNPQDNTSLEGLYLSSGNFCTQARALRRCACVLSARTGEQRRDQGTKETAA